MPREKKKTFQELKTEKIKQITKDYKIGELNSSDEEILDKLANALVILESIERQIEIVLNDLEQDPGNLESINALEKLNKSASQLRSDISKFQNDLGITRRQRESDQTQDIVKHIEKIKKAARKFAEYRTTLVFCDDCNRLIGQVWFKNPKKKGTKAVFVCDKCNKAVTYSPVKNSSSVHPKDYKRVPQYL